MTVAVLDTNILISATFWTGPPYEITILAISKKITVCTSIELLDEYARILKRDFNQDQKQIEEKIEAILKFSKTVNPTTKINEIKEDPQDNKVLEAAVEAEADYIVSGDKHLLKLKEFKGIKIVKAKEFLGNFSKIR